MPRVSALEELAEVLRREVPTSSPRYLDLSGHTTRHAKLLRLGSTVVDMLVPAVERFFTTLGRARTLQQLNIEGVRLLGCGTALVPTGQRTLRRLSQVLGLPVFGSKISILKSHYNEHGFDPAFEHILIESAELPRR